MLKQNTWDIIITQIRIIRFFSQIRSVSPILCACTFMYTVKIWCLCTSSRFTGQHVSSLPLVFINTFPSVITRVPGKLHRGK